MSTQTKDRWNAVRWPLLLTVAIVVALAVRIVDVWPQLPEIVGSHFGADGQPNGFMSKAGFFWVMGLVGGGTVALLFVIPLFIRRLPAHMLNVPNRKYWLATDERRIEALDRLASLLGWTSMATAALLAIAIEFAIVANIERTGFANGPFVVCLAAYFVFTIGVAIMKMRSLAVPDPEVRT